MGFFGTLATNFESTATNFFGKISGATNDYIDKFGAEILPNWTKDQLNEQAQDLLNQDTYNKLASQKRVEEASGQGFAATKLAGMVPAWFDKNTTENYNQPVTRESDTTGKLLVLAGAVLVGLLLLKHF